MRRIRSVLLGLTILGLVSTGCVSYAPLLITASNLPGPGEPKGEMVEGRSCQAFLFAFLPLGKGNLAREALDNAKSAGRTERLTDVTVDRKGIVFFPIFAQSCTIVHGIPAK